VSQQAFISSGVGRDVDALACTVQEHIVFGPGQYDPQSVYGRELFAHELVHSLQQSTSDGSILTREKLSIREPNDASKREAEMASRTIAQEQTRSTPFNSAE
jgi:hypothetical protein